jgi:farnesol dehydrogenase
MKYFVTGATGFIGYHLSKSLIENGGEVNALCRSEAKSSLLPSEVNIIYGGILDRDALRRGMKGCDYVFHLAAYAKVWAKDSGIYYEINVRGTNNVLDIAIESGVKRVVVVSTAGVFGASFEETVREGFIRRKDFFNEYEGSKALSESYIKDYVLSGLDVVVVSPTRVYGPYLFGEPESVTLLIKKYLSGRWRFLPGPPDRIGNYVYVGDVVDGMQLALSHGKAGRTYILGGENHSYRDFFQVLSSVTGIRRRMFSIPIFISSFFSLLQLISAKLFGRAPLITPKWIAKARYHWRVSSERAIEELGYSITPLDEGIRKTIEGSDWKASFHKGP